MNEEIHEKDYCPWCKELIKIIPIRNSKKKGPKIGMKYGCFNKDCIVQPSLKIFGDVKLLLKNAQNEWRKWE